MSDDIRAAAIIALHDDNWDDPVAVVSKAIATERERCAKIADDHYYSRRNDLTAYDCDVGTAIRRGLPIVGSVGKADEL